MLIKLNVAHLGFTLPLMLILIIFPPALAEAKWSLTPRIYVEEQYDDNIFLTETNEQDDFITTVSPGVNLNYEAPTGEINLDYEFRRSLYSDFSELDFSGHRGRADARKDFVSWFSAGIRETYIRSQDPIELTGLEEFERPSIRTGRRNCYTRNIVEPEVTFRFGENRSIQLGYRNAIFRNERKDIADGDENAGNALLIFRINIHNEIDVFYEHINLEYGETVPPTDDQDFDGDEIGGRYTYYFNPKTSAFLEYQYYQRDFETAGSTDYKVHDATGGFSRELFENVTLSASAGYTVRDAEGQENEGTFSGTGALSGDLSPYARLSLSVYGEAGFDDDYTSAETLGSSEFWMAGFNTTYQPLEKLWLGGFFYIRGDDYLNSDRRDRLWSARGNVNYQFLRWLFLSIEYVHNERDSNIPLESYEDNRYFGRLTAQYDIAERFQ